MCIFLIFVGLIFFPTVFISAQITSGPNGGCPGGNAIYQDIAVIYELSYYPDNSSLDYSQEIGNAIYSKLFFGSAYQFFDVYENRVTQITAIPFPNTVNYNLLGYLKNYAVIRNQTAFQELIENQVTFASFGYLNHPATSQISDALSYLTSFLQNGRRSAPVANTIVIIAKRDSDVSASQKYTSDLKSSGSKIMTIGVGNGSLSDLGSLSSGDGYSFLLPDITDTNALNNLALQISTTLLNDCGTTLSPPNYSTSSSSPTTQPLTSTMPSTSTSMASSITTTSTPISSSIASSITTTIPSSTTTLMSTSTSTSTSTTLLTSTTTTTPSTTTTTTSLPVTTTTTIPPSTAPVTTTTRPPPPPTTTTTTTTTKASTTPPPNPCQPGGTFINQDITLIYDISKTNDNVTDTQMPNFISTTLFSPSPYSFDYFRPIPVPFPRTSDFAAFFAIPIAFSNINTLQHYQTILNTQTALSTHFSANQSIVNDALTYLIANPLKGRPNIPENIIIVAKNANNIDQSTINNAQTLKSGGMTIITIGVGNKDFSKLFNLATSNDYTFTIYDLTDSNTVSTIVNSIATKLANLCATNFV